MDRKKIYENNYFRIYEKEQIISLENLKGGAAILPVTETGKVILLSIYRKAINGISLEIPRGFSENEEEPMLTAQREMNEEISCTSKSIISMGYTYTDTGLMNSKVHLFLGLDTKMYKQELQESEGIQNIKIYDYETIYKMALDGEINDSYTLAAILRSKKYI